MAVQSSGSSGSDDTMGRMYGPVPAAKQRLNSYKTCSQLRVVAGRAACLGHSQLPALQRQTVKAQRSVLEVVRSCKGKPSRFQRDVLSNRNPTTSGQRAVRAQLSRRWVGVD